MSTHAVASPAAEFPYFTEEHDIIRKTVKRFCLEEIAPHAEKWDDEGIFPRELFHKAGALGLFGIRDRSEVGRERQRLVGHGRVSRIHGVLR